MKVIGKLANLSKILIGIGLPKAAAQTLDIISKLAKEEDFDGEPWVVNIEQITNSNNNFRTTKWTGEHYQMTLMSIKPGEDIGLELHEDVDQFLRIETGSGKIEMGKSKNDLKEWEAEKDFAVFVPAGTWHNLTNVGGSDLKLYSIYSPPQHPKGTIHKTKKDAEKAQH